MNRRFVIVIAVLLALATVLGACNQAPAPAPTATPVPPTPTPGEAPTAAARGGVDVALANIVQPELAVLARANGVEILAEDYMKELSEQLYYITDRYGVDWNDEQAQAQLPPFQDQVLQQMIQVELARQLAEAESIAVSEEEVEESLTKTQADILAAGSYESYEAFLTAMGLDDAAFRKQIRTVLIFEKLGAAHGAPEQLEQIHASHILVETKETADEVLAKLQAGESFADLAKTYSIDTSNKDNGGDLGWFPKGMMVASFDDAAWALEPGQTSEVVQTEFGYHIILLQEREVRELSEDIRPTVQEQYFQEWFSGKMAAANVEVLMQFSAPAS